MICGGHESGEGTVWWRWKWVQGVCGAAVRGVLVPVAASGAGFASRFALLRVTLRASVRGRVCRFAMRFACASYIYQMHERSGLPFIYYHDHLCFYR